MELKTLVAETRTSTGKNAARRTRVLNKVPAVLYGGESREAVSLTVDAKQLAMLLAEAGAHAVVQLDVADNPALSTPTMVKDVQRHPLREHVTHADFLRIRLDERILTAVPITFVGQTKGVVEGGLLEHFLREIEIECLALEVPEFIEIDTTNWDIGHSFHVADIVPPAGITIVTEGDRTVAAVHAPRVATAAEGEAAEAAAVPEVGEAKSDE
jgi:large subunit ribosomal protein L25